jgi:hypothetical protein
MVPGRSAVGAQEASTDGVSRTRCDIVTASVRGLSPPLPADRLSPPHNLVECERDGLPPHQLACSYANRNTPLAHEQAASLAGAGVVVFLGTLAVLGGAERRRLHRRHEVPVAQR